MPNKKLTLKLFKEYYGVCRLDTTNRIPEWVKDSDFFSITKTSDELSIVCLESSVPDNIKCERDWRILKIEGPLDFSLIGILADISNILAQKAISIFAISTYDTDYILIKSKDVKPAVTALIENDYDIIDE